MIIEKIVTGEYETNCYIIKSGDDWAIIDPGEDAPVILERLEELNIKPKFIINTHNHLDHTFANEEIKEKTGAKILIHENENVFLEFEPDKYLTEGEEIKIGGETLKVIHTPGHTKGSICLLNNDVIFTGDTLFCDGVGRTDLLGGDEDELQNSLLKIAPLLKPGVVILPGHGPEFKID